MSPTRTFTCVHFRLRSPRYIIRLFYCVQYCPIHALAYVFHVSMARNSM